MHLTYDEDSLRARKALVRQSALFDHIEDMRLVTRVPYETCGMPSVRRRNYKGPNMGNKNAHIANMGNNNAIVAGSSCCFAP